MLHEDLARMTQYDILEDTEFLLKATLLTKVKDVKSGRGSYAVTPFFHSYVVERMTEKNKKETLLHLA
jgi:hypothetical protein